MKKSAASALAGALWQFVGPGATFAAGAGLAALSFLMTLLAIRGAPPAAGEGYA